MSWSDPQNRVFWWVDFQWSFRIHWKCVVLVLQGVAFLPVAWQGDRYPQESLRFEAHLTAPVFGAVKTLGDRFSWVKTPQQIEGSPRFKNTFFCSGFRLNHFNLNSLLLQPLHHPPPSQVGQLEAKPICCGSLVLSEKPIMWCFNRSGQNASLPCLLYMLHNSELWWMCGSSMVFSRMQGALNCLWYMYGNGPIDSSQLV